MVIETKISFKEYRGLLFTLMYRKPMMRVLLCVALGMIAWITAYYFHFLQIPEPKIYQYITLILITLVQPFVIYWTIKENYRSSGLLGEQLVLELTRELIKIQGQSFYMEIKWQYIYRIEERKKWFLIYQNNLSAIIIPKKDLSQEQHQELLDIFGQVENVPIELLAVR